MQLTLRATDRWKQKMKIGYARVSTIEQNLDLQIRALKAAGPEKIFTDQGVSGASVIKPAYFEALVFARPGDEIMVWKLNRLSRSLRDLIDTVEQLKDRALIWSFSTSQAICRSVHQAVRCCSICSPSFMSRPAPSLSGASVPSQ